MDFREELKKERARLEITQAELSDVLGVPKRTIESWEMGDRKPPDYVQRLILYKLKELAV